MKTKKLVFSAMLAAMGILTGSVIYIPVGVSKCFPVQHAINVICAVFLGPVYALITSFCIALTRNLLGTGSIMAFPGSMAGAFLASIVYKQTKSYFGAAAGEIVGTGIIGALIAAPLSRLLMGSEAGALLYVVPFLLSSTSGAVIGLLILKSAEILKLSKKLN